VLRVAAADGENPQLVVEADHCGGADAGAILAEQKAELVGTQHAADGLATLEQATDVLLGLGGADAAADRQCRLAEQDQADVGHLKLMAQAVFHRADHLFQTTGVEQVEHQAAGLVEQAVVVARHVHQLRQPMAHLDVALAQQLDLTLHQRHRGAWLMRNAQLGDQLVVIDEEFRVGAQVGGDGFGVG